MTSDRYGEPEDPEPDVVYPNTTAGWFDYWRSLLGVVRKPEEKK